MTSLVFRAPKNGSALVFEGPLNVGGTLFTVTLSATEAPVASIAVVKAKNLVLTAIQTPLASLSKLVLSTKTATQAPINTVITTTTINGSLAMVSQQPVASLQKTILKELSAIQASIASIVATFVSGSGHSTFFITLTATQQPVALLVKSIQNIKSATQAAVASVSSVVSHTPVFIQMTISAVQQPVASVFVHVLTTYNITISATQRSVASVTMFVDKLAAAGWRKGGALICAIGRMMGR